MKIKKIFVLALAALMTFTSTYVAFADTKENTRKEEIVYTATNPDGSIKGSYIVNGFELDKDQKIIDYGKYENVKNLSSLDEIQINGNEISIDAKEGKFFYQGDNPKRELPWKINLEFYLDNTKKAPEDIVGASGNIVIKGQVKKNPLANPIYSEYYMGQLALNIDSKNAIVKESEGATLAYQGSVQILNYTILPDNELEFEIKLDSKDFEMQPFNFSAIPFNMDFDMPDMSEMTDSLRQLEDGIAQLNDGTNELYKGISQFTDSSNLLYSSIKQIYDGVVQTKDGQNQITDGTSQFHSGLSQYADGINQMVSQIGEMGDGLGQLKSGLIALKDGSSSLTNGLKLYNDGLSEYTTGVNELAKGYSEFNDGIAKMATESQPLKDAGYQLVSGSQQIYDGLAILDEIDFTEDISKEDMENIALIIDQILEFWDQAETLVDEIDLDELIDQLINISIETRDALNELINLSNQLNIDEIIERLGIEDLDNEDVQKLLAEMTRIQNQIKAMNEKLQLIVDAIDRLESNQDLIKQIKDAIKENKDMLEEKLLPLKEALKEYDPEKAYDMLVQLSTFRTEYKKFHDGLIQYTNGTSQLVDGISNQLLPGSIEINKGLVKLGDGGNILYKEFNKLIEGSSQITEGLSQIVSKLDFGDISQLSQLKTGIDLLLKNHSKILSGQNDLAIGLRQLSSGLGQYIEGFEQFTEGGDQLKDGAGQLSDGTNRLRNETDGMSDKAQEGIDEALAAFNKEGFKLESFIDENNKNINLVQFVYVSDSLVKEEVQTELPIEAEKSFWEKILDIIIFWD